MSWRRYDNAKARRYLAKAQMQGDAQRYKQMQEVRVRATLEQYVTGNR